MRRCCRDANLADDLSQQVFLQAWRGIRKIRNPDKFGAWLKRTAVSVWMQHQRKNDPLWNADDVETAPLAKQDATPLGMDIDWALATLPGRIRLCVVLSCHERMSHGEISGLTKIPLGTVKSNIRRGTEHLRKLLSAYGESA